MKKLFYFVCLTGIFLSGLSCSNLMMAGGSSSTDNGKIAGTICLPTGAAAPRTQVLLYPVAYDPLKDIAAVRADTTDDMGRYSFIHIASGSYNVVSIQIDDRTRSLVKGIAVAADTVTVPPDTLQRPGAVRVVLPGGFNTGLGYLVIPGTSIFSPVSDSNGTVVLDSVPASVNLSVYYSVRGNPSQAQLIRDSVVVEPGGIMNVEYVGWKYSHKLVLNTTASGAGVAGTVTGFPVLVRLTNANFTFTEARTDGADVRFTKSDGTPLPYEIEQWDASQGSAEIWVKVDTIYGNDSSHFITMYWGASTGSATVSSSNGATVFDVADGFQGVWHLNDPVSGLVKDATINGYNGTPVNAAAQSAVGGMIGGGRGLHGDSGYIVLQGTADSKLNFQENGTYAVSAWASIDTLDNMNHAIVAKSDQQYNMEIYSMDWEFAEYKSSKQWEWSRSPATAKQWTFVVGVRNGSRQYLFVNGICVDSIIKIPAVTSSDRNTGYPVMFGKTDGSAQAGGFPYYFHGALDEIRMLNVAPNADWIKLCYMNQKSQDALVEFK
jgi:hypothetical protein